MRLNKNLRMLNVILRGIEVDGENVDEDRTCMNCDLDCQFEDGLGERIDVGDEFDCCIGYDEVQIHLFFF
jgi:hypothetical protein